MSRSEPSYEELKELIRGRVRNGLITFWQSVTEAIANLKEMKKTGRVEMGEYEYSIVTVFDLRKVMMDDGSKVIDVNFTDKTCWGVTLRGPDKLGNPLDVTVRLPKDENQLLQVTSFLLSKP